MRVLHVIPAVAPRYGGPSTAIWPMTSALRDVGVDVELATTNVDGPGRLSRDALPKESVPVHLFDGSSSLATWLAEHVREFDLVHSHSLWNRPSAAACRLARRAGRPYVVRPCGMLSEYSWQRSAWKKRAYWWAVERRNVLGAAALHATSAGERADILKCGVTAPVIDVPLGIEPAAFDVPARPDWLRSKCGPRAGDRPIVLFLSRLHPKKGVVDLLLPAFAQLKTPAHLAIAGGVDDSTPGYGIEVERTIAALALGERVSLLGPIAPADRWAAYDGAAVFCLPSHSENFGIVVIEAMARGCPVVATRAVEAIEHAVAAGCGRSVPLEVGAISIALEEYLECPRPREIPHRERIGHLTWPGIATRIASLYSTVLDRRANGSN